MKQIRLYILVIALLSFVGMPSAFAGRGGGSSAGAQEQQIDNQMERGLILQEQKAKNRGQGDLIEMDEDGKLVPVTAQGIQDGKSNVETRAFGKDTTALEGTEGKATDQK